MALAGGAGSLTREQALGVRERCLRALKERLIERANIIQVRAWAWACAFGGGHGVGVWHRGWAVEEGACSLSLSSVRMQ
jgi:hypothetical protein